MPRWPTATSNSVFVKSAGDLTAGGNGIIATSSAVAVADLTQSVTQDNTNSVNAVGTFIGGGLQREQLDALGGGQDQSVIQANLNAGFEEEDPGQEAIASATATSGSVYVQQDGTLVRGGNGITAASSAVAVVALEQSADQTNSNSLSATLERPPSDLSVPPGTVCSANQCERTRRRGSGRRHLGLG